MMRRVSHIAVCGTSVVLASIPVASRLCSTAPGAPKAPPPPPAASTAPKASPPPPAASTAPKAPPPPPAASTAPKAPPPPPAASAAPKAPPPPSATIAKSKLSALRPAPPQPPSRHPSSRDERRLPDHHQQQRYSRTTSASVAQRSPPPPAPPARPQAPPLVDPFKTFSKIAPASASAGGGMGSPDDQSQKDPTAATFTEATPSRLRRSMSLDIEEAVKDAARTRSAKHFSGPQEEEENIVPEGAGGVATAECGKQKEASSFVDVSHRAEKLKPVDEKLAQSLDAHEIPVELGGDAGSAGAKKEADTEAAAATAPTAGAATTEAAAADNQQSNIKCTSAATKKRPWVTHTVRELEPHAVWRGQMPYTDNSATCVRLVAQRHIPPHPGRDGAGSAAGHCTFLIQLIENPSLAESAPKALDRMLDELEKQLASHNSSINKNDGASAAQERVIVRLEALPGCDFFVSRQSPLELPSAHAQQAYHTMRERVLLRMRSLAGTNDRVVFVAEARNRTTDFGAEVFFACQNRLIPVRHDGGSDAANELSTNAEVAMAVVEIGFPLLRTGVFPTSTTVDFFRRQRGVRFLLERLPSLHRFGSESLIPAGLAFASAPVNEEGLLLGEQEGSHARAVRRGTALAQYPHHWSTFLENVCVTSLCRTPQSRRTLVEKCLLPRAYVENLKSLNTTDSSSDGSNANSLIARAWLEYTLASITNSPDSASAAHTASLSVLQSFRTRSSAIGNAARLARAVAATQRHTLPPPIAKPRFVTFKRAEMERWEAKAKGLASLLLLRASEEDAGAEAVTSRETSVSGSSDAILLDCSASVFEDTFEFVKANRGGAFSALTACDYGLPARRQQHPYHHSEELEQQSARPMMMMMSAVLVGDEAVARPLTSRLPCCALVTTVSTNPVAPNAAWLQQVRLFSREEWPRDLAEDALSAALAYLQSVRSPYVLCKGPASQRLVVALTSEAVLAAASQPVLFVDRAAAHHLQLHEGPFALMDQYGGPRVAKMLSAVQAYKAATAATCEQSRGEEGLKDLKTATATTRMMTTNSARAGEDRLGRGLEGMARNGLLGCGSVSGGFYRYSAAIAGESSETSLGVPLVPPIANQDAFDAFFFRTSTPWMTALRLLAAVVNECCDMLVAQELLSTEDVNMLSVAALGMRLTSGGVLALVDQHPSGLGSLADNFDALAERYAAPHLRAHPLLRAMATREETFASLSNETLEAVRSQMRMP